VNPTSASSRKVTSRRLRALLGKGLCLRSRQAARMIGKACEKYSRTQRRRSAAVFVAAAWVRSLLDVFHVFDDAGLQDGPLKV
jgi:hypothetical protein